jgi:hypothetical protein
MVHAGECFGVGLKPTQLMKIICALLLLVVAIVGVRGQATNAPGVINNAAPLSNVEQWSLTGFVRHPEQAPTLTLEEKPNELRLGNLRLSGIAVEAIRMDQPFQLINPWAPPEYGESTDNAVFSLITNRVTGWKLFAFEF